MATLSLPGAFGTDTGRSWAVTLRRGRDSVIDGWDLGRFSTNVEVDAARDYRPAKCVGWL
jgi:hypothetical protein